MVLAKVQSRLLYRPHRLVVGLKHAVVVLHTVCCSLIIKLIVAQLIIMAAHHSLVAKALSFVIARPRVLPIMIGEYSDGVQNWAGRWCAYLPTCNTEPIFYIGINGNSFKADRWVLEVSLVGGLHLELLENGVSESEVRVL